MKLTFYGGTEEVGRSCIAINDEYLFDAGIKISEEGAQYPHDFDVRKIKAAFISHAHLDHTGALPLYNHKGLMCDIFCTSMTKLTTKLLLKDSLHIELITNYNPGYGKENILNVMGLIKNVNYNKNYNADGCKFKFYDAGHIPGSASILLKTGGKRILYTGDINTTDTKLMKGANYNIKDTDIMICESTYGDRNHTERKKTENDFLNSVQKTLANGGTVLIPAFAVGRSQEILQILNKRKYGVPIYLDGMSKKVTTSYINNPRFIRNHEELKNSVSNVSFVKGWKSRKELLKKQSIIVTTSGMLDGGPVLDYLSVLHNDSRSSILMTGYQAENSNGRLLLDDGRVFIDGMRMKVYCQVKKYDFSAHAGQKELVSLISRIAPKHLVLQHGDPESLIALSKKIDKKIKVYIPKFGESIQID